MHHTTFPCTAWRLLTALSATGLIAAAPSAHAIVTAELRVGSPGEHVFPKLGESGVIGNSVGTKELAIPGLPTTRAAVEGNLSAGTLRAVAQTDYFRADWDATGFSDSYSGASARVTMSDTVTFSNVAIGAVGHLDLLVTGSFSTVPDARRIPNGTANASAQVFSADRRVNLMRQAWFAADADSLFALPPFVHNEAVVGSSVSYFDTVAFELRPGSYTFTWELRASGSGYDADFGSTARVHLRLPEGVTYTSQSGVFLATAAPLSPVPLPPVLHLWLLGLGGLAAWRGVRRFHASSAVIGLHCG